MARPRHGGPSNESDRRGGERRSRWDGKDWRRRMKAARVAGEMAVALKLIHDELRPRQLRGQLCLFMEELRSSSLVLKGGFALIISHGDRERERSRPAPLSLPRCRRRRGTIIVPEREFPSTK